MEEKIESDNTIQFSCPHCGQSLEADQDMRGVQIECPTCKLAITVQSVSATGPASFGAATACPPSTPADQMGNQIRTEAPFDSGPRAAVATEGQRMNGRRNTWKILGVVFSAIARGIARGVCSLGWLIAVLLRKAIIRPILRARLARQYRKAGAFAYRNQIADSECYEIRQKIQLIKAEIDSSSLKRDELPGAGRLHVMASRLLIFLQNVLRRKQASRLHAVLGRELTERGIIDPALNIYTDRAIKTREYADRLKTMRPKLVSISNLSFGTVFVALLVLISWSKLSTTTSKDVLQSGDSLSPPIWYEAVKAQSEWNRAVERSSDPVQGMRRSIQQYNQFESR